LTFGRHPSIQVVPGWRTDGRTDEHMDGWMDGAARSLHVQLPAVGNSWPVKGTESQCNWPPFFPPDVFTFTPCPPCPVWINLAPPRGVSTYEILYFQTPLPGIRSGICIYTPRLNTRPILIFNNLNAAGSYNFKDLERAVLYFILFYFIFRCPDLVFVHPILHQTPPPIFNMALKFLLNNTKTMTIDFLFFLKDIQIGFFFVEHCTKSPPGYSIWHQIWHLIK
jgi:hypothetical protein